ncbi:MAG: TauD/TfdA family dioxygenase [Burkholderiales bacterium]|nr:TauD/TfdA family dioxygenase [Burkholderiales bacterium]
MTDFTRKKLHAAFGIELSGIELAAIDSASAGELLGLLDEYSLLVFRRQRLPNPAMLALARRFGIVTEDVTRYESAGPSDDQPWHAVGRLEGVPAVATLLCAREIPRSGGEIEFSSTRVVYDTLPRDERRRLALLEVAHEFRRDPGRRSTQPLVLHHPRNGKPALFIGYHAARCEGMDATESGGLLRSLLDRATGDGFVHRHAWRPGDVLLWDNWSLIHRARGMPEGSRRAVDEVPVFAGQAGSARNRRMPNGAGARRQCLNRP